VGIGHVHNAIDANPGASTSTTTISTTRPELSRTERRARAASAAS
jgi:hypothetical protein